MRGPLQLCVADPRVKAGEVGRADRSGKGDRLAGMHLPKVVVHRVVLADIEDAIALSGNGIRTRPDVVRTVAALFDVRVDAGPAVVHLGGVRHPSGAVPGRSVEWRADNAPSAGIWPQTIGVVRIHREGDAELTQVRGADGAPGHVAGSGKDGEEDRRQDGNDGDHHQKLDQRETAPPHAPLHALASKCRQSILWSERYLLRKIPRPT